MSWKATDDYNSIPYHSSEGYCERVLVFITIWRQIRIHHKYNRYGVQCMKAFNISGYLHHFGQFQVEVLELSHTLNSHTIGIVKLRGMLETREISSHLMEIKCLRFQSVWLTQSAIEIPFTTQTDQHNLDIIKRDFVVNIHQTKSCLLNILIPQW